ncbi:tetratricopeptide repeat protein [Nocardia salmonicida]|uniref:tetratricopeptide repeat protein n=1 Tax=Nocardia salmonicida TaxID=53431 RepID=UPI002E2C129C|nr:tetratricopeptide repeat protein [Nocardia salmonicida]
MHGSVVGGNVAITILNQAVRDDLTEQLLRVGDFPDAAPCFVERATLDEIASAFQASTTQVSLCSLTGLRGIGKTQLAAAYARRRLAEPVAGVVAWANAESREKLEAELHRLALVLGVADPSGDTPASARAVVRALNDRPGRHLLIFDNAVDPDLIAQYRPTRTTQALITTTDHRFTVTGTQVHVSTYTRAESVRYLITRTARHDPAGADELADLLGDHALGLAVAAATILQRRNRFRTFGDYSAFLRARTLAEGLPLHAGSDYPLPVDTALRAAIDAAVDHTSGPVIDLLLRVIAILAPEGIQVDTLHRLAPKDHGVVADAIDVCCNLSILTSTGDRIVMHRLTARAVREYLLADDETLDATAQSANNILWPDVRYDSQTAHNAAVIAETTAHLDHAWSVVDDRAIATATAAALLGSLAAVVWHSARSGANLAATIERGERTAASSFTLLGAEHPNTLTSRSNLAAAYKEVGRANEAIPLYEAVVTDCLRVLGAEHPSTLASRNNLAVVFQEVGRVNEAIALYEAVVTDRVRVLGAEHPDTLTGRSNLAAAYKEVGRVNEAILLCEAVVTDRVRVLGAEHPDTLTGRNNLAAAYKEVGRVNEAIPLYEAVVTDCVRVLGAEHPFTLTSRNNLAVTYKEVGRANEAIPLCEAVVTDCVRVLGAEHPSTLTSRNNLAVTYKEVGRANEAIALYEAVVTDCVRVLGAEHPFTLTSRNNLAVTYKEVGRVNEAIALYEAVLTDRVRVLGAEHPDTLTSRNNLAYAYTEAGRVNEVIPLLEAVVTDCLRVLGAEHTSTLTSRNNLAVAYKEAGRVNEAIPLYEAVVTDCVRVLGAEHPFTLTGRNNLAFIYKEVGRVNEAIALYEAVLTDRVRVLGAEHPNTLTSRNNLAYAYQEAGRG